MKQNRIQLATICVFAFVLVFSIGAAAQGAKVEGKWDLTLHTQNETHNPPLTLTQDGSKLTGMVKGGSGDYPVTGTIDGNKITFKFSPNGDATVTFTGTVDGDSMKGTASLGDGNSDWTWTATRFKS